MYDFFTNKAQREISKYYETKAKEEIMNCTCKITKPIDWTKPLELYSLHHKKWVDCKLVATLTQGDAPYIIKTDRGTWAFDKMGEWENSQQCHIRNKAPQVKREWIDVEVYRYKNGQYWSRVVSCLEAVSPTSASADWGQKVASTPVQVSYEVNN